MNDLRENEVVLWGLTRADLFHVALHGLVVILCWLSGEYGSVYSFDPLTAGVVSVLSVEGVDIWRKQKLTLGEGRDLIFRSLGAAIGWGLGGLLVLVL